MTAKKNAIKKDILKKTEKSTTVLNKEKISKNAFDAKEYTALEYESMRDNALEMARVLREIDTELRYAAEFEGDHEGGYHAEDLLPKLCKIMYSCYVDFNHEMFN